MTPTEIRAALKELDGSIGNRGVCGVRVSLYTKEPLAGSISCNSLGISIDVEADEWAELFAKLRSAWAKARADGQRGLIKPPIDKPTLPVFVWGLVIGAAVSIPVAWATWGV